jgi:hypothetical protein
VLKINHRFSVSHIPGALNVFCDLDLWLLGQLFLLLLGEHPLFILEHQGKSKKRVTEKIIRKKEKSQDNKKI